MTPASSQGPLAPLGIPVVVAPSRAFHTPGASLSALPALTPTTPFRHPHFTDEVTEAQRG